MVGGGQDNQVFTTVVLVDADNIEQVHGESDQAGVVILFFNAFRKLLGFFSAVGVDLQQTISALFQLRFQRFMLLAAGFDQVVEAVGIFRRGEIVNQFIMHAVVNGTAGRAGVLERVQTFVIPAHQH